MTRIRNSKKEAARPETEPTAQNGGESGLVTLADLKIRTKSKTLELFHPNPVQKLYLDLLAADYAGFDPVAGTGLRGAREDALKSRQQGMSSLWLALLFLDTINTPLSQTIVAADVAERAEMLFQIVKRFYEHLPPEKRRPLRYSSKRVLHFDDIDSYLQVGTAEQDTLGRGGTLNNILASERAYWEDGDEVETGLLQSVPPEGNIIRETTANGYNAYHRERLRGRNRENGFHNRFFGWSLTPEYRSPVPSLDGSVPNAGWSEEEQRLALAYHLDAQQLAWRRRKMAELRDRFPQEYPLTEEDAFLASGNPYFDREALTRRRQEIEAQQIRPLERVLFPAAEYRQLRKAWSEGTLKIWSMPQREEWYVIGADPAGGVDTDGKRDFCAADVLSVHTWEQVATLHGRWEPHLFGLILAELGLLYNQALLGVHRNNHGHAVLAALLHTAGYPAQRGNAGSGLFFFEPSLLSGQVRQQDARLRQPGWPENTVTKPFMLDKLAESLTSAPGLLVNDPATLDELFSYIHLPGGGAGGENGAHDDRASSLALGAALLNLRFERGRAHTEIDEEIVQYCRPDALYGGGGRQP